jgi:hypothetical protein
MFVLFEQDPTKKLNKSYEDKLESAICAQKNGNINDFSMFTEEVIKIRKKIQALENANKA